MIEFDVETTSLQHHGGRQCETFLTQFLGSEQEPEHGNVELMYRDGRGAEGDYACQHDVERDYDRAIQARLDDRSELYRAHNAKFDLHCLRQAGFDLPPDRNWRDNMILCALMDDRYSNALQARGDRLFGPEVAGAALEEAVHKGLLAIDAERRKVSKATGEEFVHANYGDLDREIMDPYAAHDCTLQRMIAETYEDAVERSFHDLHELELGVLRALFWMEDRGIPMDRDCLVAMEAETLPALDELHANCVALAEFDGFNPGSPKQVSEALDRLGADVSYMTRKESGLLTTDEENLGACDHPLAAAILRWRGEHKMYEWLVGVLHGPTAEKTKRLYPAPYLTPDDRVHPNFNQVGARTGRMSCSNPNFQNIPRDDLRLRYAVKAGPGKKLVTCDLDSIELRLLAAFAGEGLMKQAILRGDDPHVQTAQLLNLRERRRSTGAVESLRDQGKKANYLTCYGGGVNAMTKWLQMSRAEAKKAKARYREVYPEVERLENRIELALEDRGYLKSPLTDRRWRVYNQDHPERESYKFINYLLQGTAADILKIATDRCHEQGVPLIAAVHDELLAEPDAADAEECGRIIEKAMTEGFEVIQEKAGVPITAEAQIVDRWSEAKKPDYIPSYIERS